MSLWWARREQLDEHQVRLIEDLPLHGRYLVLGPPGSGKTNVLLRRAQFTRTQDAPNVMVLTFTRPLAEFIKTGCLDSEGREIFPRSLVSTLEAWLRDLYEQHHAELPNVPGSLTEWKKALAGGALGFAEQKRLPKYDGLFVDEVQDLLPEEIQLLASWSNNLFFVGDDRQRIYEGTTGGLASLHGLVPAENRRLLPFHYRLAPELCRVADRIMQGAGGDSLAARSHYNGPKPGRVDVRGPLSRDEQLRQCAERLKDQVRVYKDFLNAGDRLGVIVARRNDRDSVWEFLEGDPDLAGKSKIIRSRTAGDDGYGPELDPDIPICILTVQGCKGLEFRAAHWLFCEQLSHHHAAEHYYTVVTRAKTSLDISYTDKLPQTIARAHTAAPTTEGIW